LSDLFSISTSALQAFQQAIAVTSNNIANANTPGYAEENIILSAALPQGANGVAIGDGVDVQGVTRSVDELNNSQLNSSQSTLGSLDSLQTYTNQLDNIIGTTAGGLTTALQNYYSAWSTVADDPTSTSARQALIGDAQSVATSIQTTNTQLQTLNTGINSGITSDVTQINTLTASIASLNQQISVSAGENSGQQPNELLDQRDTAISSLSKLVGISTTTDSNGAVNVFIGNGQPLVLQGVVTKLTTIPNEYNASQLDVATASNPTSSISSQITTGDLGGLLTARTTAVDPAINAVGQIATALSVTANTQQNSGLNLSGELGANLFTVGSPQVVASSNNTSTVTATVSPVTSANVGALTSDNYLIAYNNGAYSVTDTSTGKAAAGATVTGNTIAVGGLTVTLSGTPNNGDTFLLQPTAAAAGGFAVSLTNPSQIAAAGAVVASAASTNTGSGAVSSGTVVDPTNANLLTPATIKFTSATTYSINAVGNYAYTSGGTIPPATATQDGWQVQITGTPATGDVFTVQSNASGTGDNRNALAAAAGQTTGVLSGGTTSIDGATSALVTNIGSQAQQVNTSQTAQTAINTQALANVQSVSGVNLDEEAANLLKWQESYQASAQALQIGNSVFTSLLAAISATA
jgi:flagellar hook-associated protein 1 FlgK